MLQYLESSAILAPQCLQYILYRHLFTPSAPRQWFATRRRGAEKSAGRPLIGSHANLRPREKRNSLRKYNTRAGKKQTKSGKNAVKNCTFVASFKLNHHENTILRSGKRGNGQQTPHHYRQGNHYPTRLRYVSR